MRIRLAQGRARTPLARVECRWHSPAMSLPRPVLATLLALVLAGCTPTPHADTPAGPRGLQQPVTVVTDEWGIPHVEARTLGDVYHAWGWVVARDRLWQLLDSRARSEGVEHLWLGNSALASDGGAQLFRITERAEG